jgi:hypothetical protein
VGALVWGPRQDLLATAKARVATLQSSGFPTAQLYGETQAGGLGRLSILLGDPGRYNLPVNPQTPLVATAWKKVLQPLGEVAIGASIVGAIAAFLISRKHIRMQDVD